MKPRYNCQFLVGVLTLTMNMIIVTANGAKPPNIVLFVADDMGWADVSWHNDGVTVMPALDALYKEGLELDQHYVMNTCTPTRASLLTGKYVIRMGLQHNLITPVNPWGLPTKEKTLADYLKEMGYMTHGIGKWHLGCHTSEHTPCNRGFDSYYGIYNGANDYVTKQIGMPGMMGVDFRKVTKDEEGVITDEILFEDSEEGTYNTYLYSDRIKEVIADHDKETPLFLYLASQNPHSPDQVPREYYDLYDQKVSDVKRRKNLAQVSAMDDMAKAAVESLKEKGMWDNTVFVFFSDNGGEVIEKYAVGQYNFPLSGGKGTYWEGGIRSPAFISSPLISSELWAPEDSKYTNLVHVVDWVPTLTYIAACGVEQGGYDNGCRGPIDNRNIPFEDEKYIDGVNQLPALLGWDSPLRNEFLINIDEDYNQASIRVGDYKLISGHVGPGDSPKPPDTWEQGHVDDPDMDTLKGHMVHPRWDHDIEDSSIKLYNVIDDPTEANNLAEIDQHKDKVKELLDAIAKYRAVLVPALNTNIREMKLFRPGGYWGPYQDNDPNYSVAGVIRDSRLHAPDKQHVSLVELSVGLQTGILCDDGFSDTDAAVICHDHGYKGGKAYKATTYRTDYVATQLNCSCSDQPLDLCSHSNHATADLKCRRGDAAGVVCYDEGFEFRTQLVRRKQKTKSTKLIFFVTGLRFGAPVDHKNMQDDLRLDTNKIQLFVGSEDSEPKSKEEPKEETKEEPKEVTKEVPITIKMKIKKSFIKIILEFETSHVDIEKDCVILKNTSEDGKYPFTPDEFCTGSPE